MSRAPPQPPGPWRRGCKAGEAGPTRRGWRADLDPALAADLDRAAAARGFASLRGAAVEIDVAGLWHDRGGHRALLELGLPGGFPQPHDHPEFPRLLVFADA